MATQSDTCAEIEPHGAATTASDADSPDAGNALTSTFEGVMYTAIYLSSASKEKLLSKFPAMHGQPFADHVTIRHYGGWGSMSTSDIPIGRVCRVQVVRHVHDRIGQALEVKVLDPDVAMLCGSTW